MERAALRSASTRPLEPFAIQSAKSTAFVDCLALGTLACALRLAWLNSYPLWADELFSVYWSQLAPSFLLGAGAHMETNPPTYYLMLHTWMQVAGVSAMSLRMPSVVFSTATVMVVYGLGRMLMGRPTALLAGIFAACDPVAIYFGQEARPYAMAALLDGLTLLSLAGAVRGFAKPGARPWGWLALFVLAATSTFLVHYTSLLFIAACFMAIGLHLVTTRPFPVRQATIWTGAGLVIALAIAQPLSVAMSLSGSSNIAWIDKLSLWTVRVFFMDLLTYPGMTYTAMSVAACVALLLVLAVAAPRWRPDRVEFGVLVLISAFFCLLLVGISVSRPMLLSRVGLWLTIPLCLLLARAATLQPTTLHRGMAVVVTGSLFLLSFVHYHLAFAKEDWPEAARLAAAAPQCGGPVLFGGAFGLGLLYYWPELTSRSVYAVPPLEPYRQTAEFALMRMVMHPRTVDDEALPELIRTHPGAVLVLRNGFARVGPPSLPEVLAQARFHARLGGDLTVDCF